MRQDKIEAYRLRRLGRSYKEITSILGTPKSTLSGWLGKLDWSKDIASSLALKAKKVNTARIITLDEIRGKNLMRAYALARHEAELELQELQHHPLFIAGIMIYWGEGDRASKHMVRIANTDPIMIKLFVSFLSSICGIRKEKIRANLLLYPDLDNKSCIDYWTKESGLRKDQFNQSVVIKGRHKTKRVQYGVCNVGTASSYLKEKLKVWLDILPSRLVSKKYYAGIVYR